MKLIFDTETTGLPLWREPSDHRDQPHIVQFAAILLDDNGQERSSVSLLVQPNRWKIPDALTAIHGITTEHAMLAGVPEGVVVDIFRALVALPDIVVAAHNESFDWRIMRIAMRRYGMDKDEVASVEACARVCTMKMADKIIKMAPTEKMVACGFLKSKPPSLQEAHQHFLGARFDKAHDALADVRATARVLAAIEGRGKAIGQ